MTDRTYYYVRFYNPEGVFEYPLWTESLMNEPQKVRPPKRAYAFQFVIRKNGSPLELSRKFYVGGIVQTKKELENKQLPGTERLLAQMDEDTSIMAIITRLGRICLFFPDDVRLEEPAELTKEDVTALFTEFQTSDLKAYNALVMFVRFGRMQCDGVTEFRLMEKGFLDENRQCPEVVRNVVRVLTGTDNWSQLP